MFHRLGAIAAFLCNQSLVCHAMLVQQLETKEQGMGLVRVAVEEFATLSILEEGSVQRKQLERNLESM